MSWAQMQETFYNCLDFCEVYGRLPYFYITGGDPILHPDFWRLLSLIKEHEIPFTILGNPFHLTDEVCRLLKSYGCATISKKAIIIYTVKNKSFPHIVLI
jgi:MoaA/NifB/PqqE/SkfB family radical SAM enzyme